MPQDKVVERVRRGSEFMTANSPLVRDDSAGAVGRNGLRHDRQLLFGGHRRDQVVMDNLGCVFITVLL